MGVVGVSLDSFIKTPTTETQKNYKKENLQKNYKTHNSQKNSKTENPKTDNIVRGRKKKVSYRGKGRKNMKENVFTVLLSNLRGFKSKETSLRKIILEKSPSLVLMNETLLVGNMKVSIPAYTSWSRNRTGKGGGGIATSVADKYKDCAVAAGQGEDEDEYLITRIDCFSPALCVINCYGEQRKAKKEDIERSWEIMRTKVEEIRTRGEICCLGGDLNKLIGTGELGVPGNHPEVSLGGRLLRNLLSTGNWILVNGLGQAIVQGGPFTRKDPATGSESCLDLFVVSRELLPYVSNLSIDSKREVAVGRAIKMGNIYKTVFSDHYTSILTLKDLPTVQKKNTEKNSHMELSKGGGLVKIQGAHRRICQII